MLFENNTRMNGLRFSPDMQTIFFRETSGTGTTANTVEVAVNLAEPAQRYTLARFRTDDPAANPGTLVGVRAGGGGQRGGRRRPARRWRRRRHRCSCRPTSRASTTRAR